MIRKLIQEILDTSSLTDATVIAEKVISSLAPADYETALRETLRPFVVQVMGESRTQRQPAPVVSGPVFSESFVERPDLAPVSSAHSWKGAVIRDGWQRRLKDRYHIGKGQRKLLQDMTYDDLLYAAGERSSLAERNAEWARKLDSWARMVEEHGVTTFGDLPAETLQYLLGT